MYTAQNYQHLLGLEGFSDKTLENHFTLYAGYVANVNKLEEEMNKMLVEGKETTLQFTELKRRFGWEFNGMRLHELYFSSLTKGGAVLDPDSDLYKKIVSNFGSMAAWEKDFRATALSRGIGWTILYHDLTSDRLYNTWINEHDAGHLTGARPLVVCDVFEHAFFLDHGPKRANYLEVYFKALDWVKIGILK